MTGTGTTRRRRFAERVVLITGSSRGYGRALARAFAAEGAHLVLNSHRSATDGRDLASEINRAGDGRAVYVCTDVGEEENLRGLAGLVADQFGRIDVIVHNAPSGFERPVDATTWYEFEVAMRVNTYALIGLARWFRPLFGERGKFLYVSSIGAERALAGYGTIGAAKAASEALIRSLALEWAPRVQANTIRPNIISSVSLRSFSWSDLLWKITDEESPLGIQDVSRLVDVALWMCSPDADYVTGQVISADGGFSTTMCRDGLTIQQRPPVNGARTVVRS
ncbi:SDR family oxidoreductase [Mangrovihabitans endophyticus]|uniref:Short-chain dehydrogenase n=1 Tax=Mangrovihabitans endophyticus TaxID=1751298 RepID=A0A8J3BSX7_9ACTN|nr:SDR family oxidoreductase [Mangrovihabitans endophyticus]GGK75413.1 short-chain dehydrogenase [Mangrovihabitans endophyticus]